MIAMMIHFEFNTQSFFNYNDYQNEDDLIYDIIEHDRDRNKYYDTFIKPWFEDNIPNQYFDQQRVRKFLFDIISNRNSYTPIAKDKFKRYIYFPIGYQVNQVKGFFKNLTR